MPKTTTKKKTAKKLAPVTNATRKKPIKLVKKATKKPAPKKSITSTKMKEKRAAKADW